VISRPDGGRIESRGCNRTRSDKSLRRRALIEQGLAAIKHPPTTMAQHLLTLARGQGLKAGVAGRRQGVAFDQ